MSLYTRQGDDGTTGLFGGQRVPKHALRVEAYGTVDELNSAIGLALVGCHHEEIASPLQQIQSELFDLGSNLCLPAGATNPHIPELNEEHVHRLERLIDLLDSRLEPMRHFVLPGGSELAARLHLARCVGRRAERLVVALHEAEGAHPVVVPYLNRLSDLLFAMARRANQLESVPDVPWKPRH